MRILYDGMIYLLQAAGGVNRYFVNLISRLPENDLPCLMTYQSRDLMLPEHRNLRIVNYPRYNPGVICSALRPAFFRAAETWQRPELVHPTYYSLLNGQTLAGAYRCPVVITVYDMILERFPDQLDPTGRNREMKRNAILAADAVLCISENSRNDLLERYKIPEEKVTVTPLASELNPSLMIGSGPVPVRPYLLYVGGRSGYKNFDALLESFARVAARYRDISLCVVGQPFSDQELLRIAVLKLTDRIEHYGSVPDGHLARLYQQSIAFVYPSLYEGFGIPPLEAMCCGTPVVACNSSSIPEVVGSAGLLFDPKAPDELTEMLLLVVGSESTREKLIAQGYERSKLFSWDKTAAQTVTVYRELAGVGRP